VEIYDPAAARADFLAGRTDETPPMLVGEVEILVLDPNREFATVRFKGRTEEVRMQPCRLSDTVGRAGPFGEAPLRVALLVAERAA
jgi:hypothetical protein